MRRVDLYTQMRDAGDSARCILRAWMHVRVKVLKLAFCYVAL